MKEFQRSPGPSTRSVPPCEKRMTGRPGNPSVDRMEIRPASAADLEPLGAVFASERGFFAGLKKKGIEVSVLERVRQVGPNKAGAKGSYTVYRVAEAG